MSTEALLCGGGPSQNQAANRRVPGANKPPHRGRHSDCSGLRSSAPGSAPAIFSKRSGAALQSGATTAAPSGGAKFWGREFRGNSGDTISNFLARTSQPGEGLATGHESGFRFRTIRYIAYSLGRRRVPTRQRRPDCGCAGGTAPGALQRSDSFTLPTFSRFRNSESKKVHRSFPLRLSRISD